MPYDLHVETGVSFVSKFVCMENKRDNAHIEIRIKMYIQVDVTYTIHCQKCSLLYAFVIHVFAFQRTEFTRTFTHTKQYERILMTNMLTLCNLQYTH